MPRLPCSSSRSLSSGCRPPLPSAGLCRTTAPASRSLGFPPTRPEPQRGSVLASTRRCRLSRLLGWRGPRRQGLPPPRLKPHWWGVLPGAPRLRLPSPSLPPPPQSPSPSRPMAPLRRFHQASAPRLVGWGVGFCPFPPARVRPPPAGIGTLWGILGFCGPQAPRLLWGVKSSHDKLTPPPFCGVESSCHDSTPPPPPYGVELSCDDSTPPPSEAQVESSGDNSTPSSTPWRIRPGVFSTPEALRPL